MSNLQKLIIDYGECREQMGWLTRYIDATPGGNVARLEGLRRLGIRKREADEMLGKVMVEIELERMATA